MLMANLGRKAGIYNVRFRYQAKEYNRSLKVRERADAEAARRSVEQTIHRLLVGLLTVPDGVDPGDFIVSGGTLTASAERRTTRPAVPSLADLIAAYLQSQQNLVADSTHELLVIHLNNWCRHLKDKVSTPSDKICHRDLDRYLRERIAATSATTAAKERRTLQRMFRWAVDQDYLDTSPASNLTPIVGEAERPPFRTLAEVEDVLDRGGLSSGDALDLWECLYLSPAEIAELLATVRKNGREELAPLLHQLPAYTGMRRGEALRLRWSDVDLSSGFVFARSRKQSRRRSEVVRRIDIHPELLQALTDWRRRRPRGQFVVSDADTLEPIDKDRANRYFWQPMRGTDWCLDSKKNWFKIGFHTYRHSFASNLAAAGVDQRIIDEWMGHSTEAMRRRYRHLFPSARRSAIESFSLVPLQS
jgi:integrase